MLDKKNVPQMTDRADALADRVYNTNPALANALWDGALELKRHIAELASAARRNAREYERAAQAADAFLAGESSCSSFIDVIALGVNTLGIVQNNDADRYAVLAAGAAERLAQTIRIAEKALPTPEEK